MDKLSFRERSGKQAVPQDGSLVFVAVNHINRPRAGDVDGRFFDNQRPLCVVIDEIEAAQVAITLLTSSPP